MRDAFRKFCEAAKPELAQLATRELCNIVETLRDSKATWHPNGFVVFNVREHPLGALRLHIWPLAERRLRHEDAHIHTHVWDLCSRVLVGTYREQFYDRAGSSSAASEYQSADIDYARDRNTFLTRASTHLQPVALVTASSGESHTVAAGVAHETLIPPDSYVATLVLTSKPRLKRATVFTRGTLPEPAYERPCLEAQSRSQLLTELLARVESELNQQ